MDKGKARKEFLQGYNRPSLEEQAEKTRQLMRKLAEHKHGGHNVRKGEENVR